MPHASRGRRNASIQFGSARFTPTGLRPVAATALEGGVEVVDLEGQVVGAVAVPGEEPDQEVVLGGVPGFEQLDGHALPGVADSDLHRSEPDELAAREHGPAELGHEPGERRGGVGGGERHVIEVRHGAQVVAGSGAGGRRPARVQARAIA